MSDGERVSPTVRLRKLARGLRRWRNEADLSLDELAPRLGWSKSKLGRFETGDGAPGPADVIAIATVLGIPDEERERYVTLAFQARQKGWWQRYDKGTLKEDFDEYVGLESEASHVREFTHQLIPGLLQTSRYAKEIMRASPGIGDVAERADLRMQRQARLHEAHPLRLSTIIHEAALRNLVGGPEVMREQLTLLIEMAKLDHVTVRALPFSAGAYPSMEAPFIILSFPEPEDPDVPFAEYLTGCVYIEDPDEIASYNLYYSALEEQALSPAKSVELISKIAGEL
ncbi:helix-turn-helix domain-containing protein [Saccharopolyspora pogona]|uniref:helix-turn-helix domain-containing protein n=1 Tax=Saccharopolyspora pogona TaxID=333966 RepID=UPI001CC25E9B|nr:helix-turn-helix transcriptional regulator [Saccharopolyspora pogona]